MTWIDFTTLIIVGYSFYKGFKDGFVLQLTSMLGLIVGAVFAGQVASFISPGLSSFFKISPHIIGPISYLVAFILILIGFSFVAKLAKGMMKAVHIGFLNSWAGALFCAFKWLLLFSVFLNIVETLDSHGFLIKEETKQKSFSHNFVKGMMPVVVPFLSYHYNDIKNTHNQQSATQK